MHDRLGGRTMLHDPAGGRISADERVEQAAAAQVPDEYPHLLLKFQMSTHIVEIRRECMFMTTLIGLDGAQEV